MYENTLTRERIKASAEWIREENSRLMLLHKSTVWATTGLWRSAQ